MKYELYGKELTVAPYSFNKNHLMVMEGFQYIRAKDNQNESIYILERIIPDVNLLVLNDFYTGSSDMLPIEDCMYCNRPE